MMLSEKITSVEFLKNNKLLKVVSIDIQGIVESVKNKNKCENIEVHFTFGDSEFDKKIKINDSVKNIKSNSMSLIFYEVKNSNNGKIIIPQKKKKENKKKEIYKERKNKEKTTKVTRLKNSKITLNPNPKTINVNYGAVKSKFYYEPEDEFVQSKEVQKVSKNNGKYTDDCHNTDVNKWSSNHLLQYMSHKFQKTYGFNSLEFSVIDGKKYQPTAKGILYVKIKSKLVSVFGEINLGLSELKNYIDWMYDIKSSELDFPITLNFLCSKAMITEWFQKTVKKRVKNTVNKTKTVNKKIHKLK